MEESIDSGVRGILINRQQKTLLLDVIGKPTNKQGKSRALRSSCATKKNVHFLLWSFAKSRFMLLAAAVGKLS